MSREVTDALVGSLGWVPAGQRLADTVGRAHLFASEQSHRDLTLEHLILALADDTDAARVLEANGVDVPRLRDFVARYISAIDVRYPPDAPDAPEPDAALRQIFDVASAAAEASDRTEIDGALIVAAIIGEGTSNAASMLRQHGLNVEGDRQADAKSADPAGSRTGRDGTEKAPEQPATQSSVTGGVQAKPTAGRQPQTPGAKAGQTNPFASAPPGHGAAVHAPQPAVLPPLQRTQRKPVRPRPVPTNGSGRPQLPQQVPPQPTSRPPGPGASEPETAHSEPEVTNESVHVIPVRDLAAIDADNLMEILPGKMQLGVPEIIEIQIPNSDIDAVTGKVEGRDMAHADAQLVSRSLSLRLRSPTGSFVIEPRSPEVHWIDDADPLDGDDTTSWRWQITGSRRGVAKLQLVASVRTVTAQGAILETAMPEQTATLNVVPGFRRVVSRLLVGFLLFALGAAAGFFARPVYRLIDGFLG
ncbi:MAG: Clp protease N-terminal domain-containing protein [Hyphomicrobiaceae bacterium]